MNVGIEVNMGLYVISYFNLRGTGDATAAGTVVDDWIDGVCGIIGAIFSVGDKIGVGIFEMVCCADVTVVVDVVVAAATMVEMAVAVVVVSVAVATAGLVTSVVMADIAEDNGDTETMCWFNDSLLSTDSEIFGSLQSVLAMAWVDIAATAGNGSGVFDAGEVPLCCGNEDAKDCLRERIRASCVDWAPILYWTISSSNRFRFIERCELHTHKQTHDC